jgi:hypothetical protein
MGKTEHRLLRGGPAERRVVRTRAS